MDHILFTVCIVGFLTLRADAQQRYSSNAAGHCAHEEGPSTDFLYTCSGQKQSCQAFLIFLSRPSYNSVDSISSLTYSPAQELASFNNVDMKAVFPTNREVIVPVPCSCEGQYFWSNVSYYLKQDESYATVANATFQGLSTCNALRLVNPHDSLRLEPRMKLQVPLRCACPTAHQAADGTKYLLTYWVNGEDHVPDIAKRFNVSVKSVVEANELPEENPVLSVRFLLKALGARIQASTPTRTIIARFYAEIRDQGTHTQRGHHILEWFGQVCLRPLSPLYGPFSFSLGTSGVQDKLTGELAGLLQYPHSSSPLLCGLTLSPAISRSNSHLSLLLLTLKMT